MTTSASSIGPLLEVKDLSIRAGGKILQQGIMLHLRPGELVAVTGPSGSGKTTFLRTVVGLQDSDSGSILLQGREPSDWGWPAYRRRVILVAQQPSLFEVTVEENLRRPFTYRTSSSPFPQERAIALLDRLGVGAERMDQSASSLSVGQKQRVSLIRALLLEPLILCLDEPTSALDVDSAQRVQSLISEETESRGLAALIVTHNPDQADNWCNRKIVLPGPKGAGI